MLFSIVQQDSRKTRLLWFTNGEFMEISRVSSETPRSSAGLQHLHQEDNDGRSFPAPKTNLNTLKILCLGCLVKVSVAVQ